MPGLFGGVGAPPETVQRLEREFCLIWPDSATRRREGSVLGGHAFFPHQCTWEPQPGFWVGADGEVSLYGAAFGEIGQPLAFDLGSDGMALRTDSVGNVAVMRDGEVHLAADWTGSFPLYYTRAGGGLLFCSHLRPLARAISASVDIVGVTQFLKDGYGTGARTPFHGISRLLGGQSLTYGPDRDLRIREHSRSLAAGEPGFRSASEAAEAATTAIREIFAALPRGSAPASLMMSAGWDSRTLLAAALSGASPEDLRCYSHGDLVSRELRLARRICASRRVPWHAEAIDERMYDWDDLLVGFGRSESLVFPHWHRAGRLLAEEGVRYVSAGVFGEMLGGRYWMAHTESGSRKARTLFTALLRGGRLFEPPLDKARVRLREAFHAHGLRRPWYLAQDALPAMEWLAAEINGDIESAFARYERRGVSTMNGLAEAFQGEHIGARYCNVQILSCRAHTDVAMPLANRRILQIASRTPLGTRLQNELNRRVVRALDPGLLRFPMGATLVPAGAPIIVQEGSRVVRKVTQMGLWSAHFATGGWVGAPRLAWANYEFLRGGRVLRRVVDSLSSHLWDSAALDGMVNRIVQGDWKVELLPTADLVGRILTIDQLVS